MGNMYITVPATDVPAIHALTGGYLNSATFINRSAVAAAYVIVSFEDGTRFRLYAGEIMNIYAEDTSATFTGGKIFTHSITLTGDNANIQIIEIVYTCKTAFQGREQVTN